MKLKRERCCDMNGENFDHHTTSPLEQTQKSTTNPSSKGGIDSDDDSSWSLWVSRSKTTYDSSKIQQNIKVNWLGGYTQASSSSSSSQQLSKLPVNVILSILEVVEKLIRASSEASQYTKNLKQSLQRIKQMNLSRQLKLAIGAILFILDDEDEQEPDDKTNKSALQDANEQIRNLQEQVRVSEQTKEDHNSESEKYKRAEEVAKDDEEEEEEVIKYEDEEEEEPYFYDQRIISIQEYDIDENLEQSGNQ
ncbi:MAG: hypothetical protein EZS28_031127 [Streblomastix strix]|uniref:Uncharacterized protein n=1 Tax=Streblomastix strix TaxID=222440 RepID=A0A5J4USG3_9EUKA|nr:MAG: hypothetical protein EZS28_031127 [Streblomastix strix]